MVSFSSCSRLKFALVCGCLAASGIAFAKTCVWTGGAGTADWAAAGNWDQLPALGDTVVFQPSGSLTVDCPTSSQTWTTKVRPATMRFLSGEVAVNIAGYEFSMQSTSNEIYVASNAKAVIVLNSSFRVWENGYKFYKTGGGELVFRCPQGETKYLENITGYYKSRELFSIGEGTLTLDANGGRMDFQSTNVVVHAGAKLVFNGDCRMHTRTLLDLGINSRFEMTDSSDVWVSDVKGAGFIYANQGTKSSRIIYYKNESDVPCFTGKFGGNLILDFDSGLKTRAAASDFTVQSGDQLSEVAAVRSFNRFFRYAPGIGEFTVGAFDGYSAGATNYLQDTEGNPVTVRAGLKNSWSLSFAGPGDLWITQASSQNLSGSRFSMTGWLGAASGGVLTLGGDNCDDFDLTKATGTLKGIRAESGGRVNFSHSTFANIELPVRGSGNIYYVSPAGAKFTDLELDGATELWLGGKSELAGGDVSVQQLNTQGGRTTVMRISGGRVHNGESIGEKETDTDVKSPDGVRTVGTHGTSSFEVTGGDYWWASGNSTADIFLRGGVFHPASGAIRNMTAGLIDADTSPRQIVFDGGKAELYAKSGSTFEFLKYGNTHDNANYIATYVTDKGGRIAARKPNGQTSNFTFWFTNSFATCTNTVKSGALVFSGWGDFVFGAPMKLNGPVEFRDGTAIICAAQLAATGDTEAAPFGSGDLRLRNARVFCDERLGAGHGISTVPLVTGSGSALVYEGACEVAARHDNNSQAKAVAVNAIRRAGPGSALYLRDGRGTASLMPRIGEGEFSTVKVAEAPEVDAATGLLKEPVILANMAGEWLSTYDVEKGFVPHDAVYGGSHASDIAGAEGKVLSAANSAALELNAGETLHVAAVRMGNFAKLTLYDNATLRIGNGTDPAMLLASVCGKFLGTNGTIDFGGSEGIVSCNNCTGTGEGNNSIACKIAGSGGVTFVADPDMDRDHRIELHGSSTYTGGTRISAVRVGARSEKCFSSGDVHILGGEASGGAVVFRKDATWANDFRIAGHGYHDFSENSSLGALEFKANAVLSGNVELVEEASVNVSAGFTGTIAGTVSGDRLRLYRSQGVLRLSGQNSYTGGTEVARSTLAVSAANGLGTGEVLLDGGSVEFDNAATITLANDWRGIGTVRLGSSEVRFTGKIDKSSDIALDCPCDVTFTEIPPFGRLINSSPRASTLTLAAGDHQLDAGAVEGVFNLVLENGARLDLGGKTLVVRRFTGERSSVNGVISETNPRKGCFLVVR